MAPVQGRFLEPPGPRLTSSSLLSARRLRRVSGLRVATVTQHLQARPEDLRVGRGPRADDGRGLRQGTPRLLFMNGEKTKSVFLKPAV